MAPGKILSASSCAVNESVIDPVSSSPYGFDLAELHCQNPGMVILRLPPNTSKRKNFRLVICLALIAPDQKRAAALGHERKHLYARLLLLDVRRSLLGHQLSSRMVFGEHRL
jgi:hypothetical protein